MYRFIDKGRRRWYYLGMELIIMLIVILIVAVVPYAASHIYDYIYGKKDKEIGWAVKAIAESLLNNPFEWKSDTYHLIRGGLKIWIANEDYALQIEMPASCRLNSAEQKYIYRSYLIWNRTYGKLQTTCAILTELAKDVETECEVPNCERKGKTHVYKKKRKH